MTVKVRPPVVSSELGRPWLREVRVGELTRSTRLETGELLAALTRARIAGEVAEAAEGPYRTPH